MLEENTKRTVFVPRGRGGHHTYNNSLERASLDILAVVTPAFPQAGTVVILFSVGAGNPSGPFAISGVCLKRMISDCLKYLRASAYSGLT